MRRAPASIGAAVTLLAVVGGGVIVLGRLAASDLQAMLLTGAFLAALAVVVLLVVRARRELLLPLGGTLAVAAVGLGLVLGVPLVTDRTVSDEVPDVVRAVGPRPRAAAPPSTDVVVAGGRFAPVAHPGEGTAAVVATADGRTLLAFTGFSTDNGPDLRVYLVPPDAAPGAVDGFVDLGALRGNVGDQVYEVPTDVAVGEGWRVSVWCRAFAVGFTEATLNRTS